MRNRIVETRDDGSVLLETVISVGIILTALAAFFVFIMQSITVFGNASNLQKVNAVASSELEKTASIPWQDLMPAGNGECTTNSGGEGGGRVVSGATLQQGPNEVIVDNLEMSVTRSVEWSDGTPVTCTAGNMERDDMKIVTVNVKWFNGNMEDPEEGNDYSVSRAVARF